MYFCDRISHSGEYKILQFEKLDVLVGLIAIGLRGLGAQLPSILKSLSPPPSTQRKFENYIQRADGVELPYTNSTSRASEKNLAHHPLNAIFDARSPFIYKHPLHLAK